MRLHLMQLQEPAFVVQVFVNLFQYLKTCGIQQVQLRQLQGERIARWGRSGGVQHHVHFGGCAKKERTGDLVSG